MKLNQIAGTSGECIVCYHDDNNTLQSIFTELCGDVDEVPHRKAGGGLVWAKGTDGIPLASEEVEEVDNLYHWLLQNRVVVVHDPKETYCQIKRNRVPATIHWLSGGQNVVMRKDGSGEPFPVYSGNVLLIVPHLQF